VIEKVWISLIDEFNISSSSKDNIQTSPLRVRTIILADILKALERERENNELGRVCSGVASAIPQEFLRNPRESRRGRELGRVVVQQRAPVATRQKLLAPPLRAKATTSALHHMGGVDDAFPHTSGTPSAKQTLRGGVARGQHLRGC
jgi:hypothetical protein